MNDPSTRFRHRLLIRSRRGFAVHWLVPLILLFATPMRAGSGLVTDLVPSDPLRPDEAALIGIFKGTVDVVASDVKIDRAKLLDRVLETGAVDFVQYADDDRKTTRITSSPAARTPPGWPREDGKPVMIGVPGESTSWLVRDGDAVVMPVQLDLGESVSVRYDPPEVRFFAGPDPKPVDMGVRVYDLHGTGDPEHTGSLRVTMVDRGVRRITTPGGVFDVVMYRSDYQGEIGPASVKDTGIIFVSPTHGVVASVNHKKVSAMIFYNKDTRLAFALAAPSGGGPESRSDG